MTVFRGRVALKMDPKGRLSFPLIHRQALAKSRSIVITNNIFQGEPCLDILTFKNWVELEKKISKLPEFDENVQAFRRFYMASGTICDLDSQGRVLVPQLLREYANLEDEVMLVGMGSKIEMWSQDRWQKIFSSLEKSFEENQRGLALLERERKK